MKIVTVTLLVALLTMTSAVQAGVVVGATRLIYDGGKKESSLKINNPDATPYLIQTWVENPLSGTEKAPFIVTPPLFRLDGGQQNILRVVHAGGNLPADRESMYWINIKSVPSTQDTNKNSLKIALTTRIKLMYRPEGVKGIPEEVAGKLTWQHRGTHLHVTNPTPFYMNFYEISVAGKEVNDVTYVAPGSTASFTLPAGVMTGSVSWKIVSDYGAISEAYTAGL